MIPNKDGPDVAVEAFQSEEERKIDIHFSSGGNTEIVKSLDLDVAAVDFSTEFVEAAQKSCQVDIGDSLIVEFTPSAREDGAPSFFEEVPSVEEDIEFNELASGVQNQMDAQEERKAQEEFAEGYIAQFGEDTGEEDEDIEYTYNPEEFEIG